MTPPPVLENGGVFRKILLGMCGAGAGGEAGMLGSAAERHGQQHMEGLGANFSR